MAEKGGIKTLAIITICVMLITIGLSGCVEDKNENEEKTETKKGFYYIVDIEPNRDGKYSVIIPIPIYLNNSISPIMDKLETIKGNCSYIISETEKGFGLNITAFNNVKIESRGYYINDRGLFDILSMRNFSKSDRQHEFPDFLNIEHWINFMNHNNVSNITISIKCKSGGHYSEIITTIFKEGWQTVYGYEENVVP